MKIPSDAEAAKLSPDELRRAYIENLHILRSLALENDALKRTGTKSTEARLAEALTLKDARINNLEKEVKLIASRLHANQQQLIDALKREETSESKLSASKKIGVSNDRKEWQAENDRLRRQYSDDMDLLKKQYAQTIDSLRAENEELVKARAILMKDIQQTKVDAATTRTEIRKVRNHMNFLEDGDKTLRQELAQCEKISHTLRTENQRLAAIAMESTAVSQERDQLLERTSALGQQVSSLTKVSETLKSQLPSEHHNGPSYIDLDHTNRKLKFENDKILAKYNSMEQQLALKAGLWLESLARSKDKKNRNRARRMIDDISKDTVVENMTAQNDSLKKECERLRSQVRQIAAELAKQASELTVLRQNNQQFPKYVDMQRELAQCQSKLASIEMGRAREAQFSPIPPPRKTRKFDSPRNHSAAPPPTSTKWKSAEGLSARGTIKKEGFPKIPK